MFRDLCLYLYLQCGERIIGEIGDSPKALRKKSMLRRAKHGKPCPNIPDFSAGLVGQNGVPSKEGKPERAKRLEFRKNSSLGVGGDGTGTFSHFTPLLVKSIAKQ